MLSVISRKKFFADDRGQAIVVVAVFMGLIAIGFMAIAVDAGSLFRQKRAAQSAADAASHAAAEELALGYSAAEEQSVANQVAKLNGFDTTLATNPATVVLATPASGTFSGSNYVQATVSKPIHTMFMGAFKSTFADMTISAKAIAGGSNSSPTCVCLLGTSGQDLLMNNGSKISGTACGIVENSSSSQAISMYGGANITALSLGTVSTTWDNGSNIYGGATISASTKIVQGISNGCSPALPAVPSYGTCVGDPGGAGGTITVGPATAGGTVCYTSLTVGANGGVVTLKSGIYVISNGYVHFENGANGHSNLGGDGVFFYMLSGGSILIDNGANVNIVAGGATESGGATAPSLGAYNGILVYQPASNTTAMAIAGGATAYMSGAIDVPGATVTMSNGSGSTITSSIVAQTLTVTGGATINSTSSGNAGNLMLTSPKVVQ